jgi:type-F conjugative transfer system protein TrbI
MVVLELGGLEDRPSLLVAVMFSLILYIENRMYRTRSLKKLNVIDEGWRLLDFKNNKVGAFIEKATVPPAAIQVRTSPLRRTSSILTRKRPPAPPARHGVTRPTKLSSSSPPKSSPSTTSCTDQYSQLQRDMIKGFGSAKDNWFSSFMLSVEHLTSWHRLFVDPLSRAMYSSDGPDFEFLQQRRREGLSIHEAVWELAWKNPGRKWPRWSAGFTSMKEDHLMKKHVLINAALIAGTLAAGAGISWLVCQLNRPVVVAFNMKSTVDAFFDSAGRRSLDEAQTKALSDRFNASLEASLRDWQVRHRALILVAPAVVQGAPDITREIQTDVARRMKEGGDARPCPGPDAADRQRDGR